MIKKTIVVLAVIGLGLLGVWVSIPPHAQEPILLAQASEEEEDPHLRPVTDADLQHFISVYKTMQSDHGLTIEEALAGHGMSLTEFRDLERRVQDSSMLVQRVREALLEHAKSQAVFAQHQSQGDEKADKTPEAKP